MPNLDEIWPQAPGEEMPHYRSEAAPPTLVENREPEDIEFVEKVPDYKFLGSLPSYPQKRFPSFYSNCIKPPFTKIKFSIC